MRFFLYIINTDFYQTQKKSHPIIQDVYNWGPIQSNTQITKIHQIKNRT